MFFCGGDIVTGFMKRSFAHGFLVFSSYVLHVVHECVMGMGKRSTGQGHDSAK